MLRSAPLFIAAAALLLIGLWLGIKPSGTATQAATNQQRHYQYQLKSSDLTGPAVMPVKQGDQVQILLLSDSNGSLHLHGYELIKTVHADIPIELAFTAVQAGRFELELHGPDRVLGTLEVYPAP